GDYRAASQAFFRAVGDLGKSVFVDDADFAAIEAMEAAGDDAGADKEWGRWEKRYPQSPLRAEARLHMAWNSIRRGDSDEASKRLRALLAASPWMASDPRVGLARGTVAYLKGDVTAALAALGPKPQGAPATYLRALCLSRQGDRLKAAALLQ